MRLIFIGLLTLLFVTFTPVFAEEDIKLEVFYPKMGEEINASSVFVVGNTDPKAKLAINNKQAKVYPNGAFVEITPLYRGCNTINIVATKEHAEKKLKLLINVPEYQKTIPSSPMKIEESSVQPSQNILYKPGDVIGVSFKASTGQKAYFSIGEKVKDIPMKEQSPKKVFAAPIFGKETQVSEGMVSGIYKGYYKIKPQDNFNNEAIKVKIVSNAGEKTAFAKGKISTMHPELHPVVAEVIKDYAITRNAPGKSRLTELPQGTMLNITGKVGNNYRFNYSDSMEGWISQGDIRIYPAGSFIPESDVRLFNVEQDEKNVYLKVPLSEKLPFIIEQTAPDEMFLKIYGAVGDLALFSYGQTKNFIEEVKWIQEDKDTLKLFVKTGTNQFWGYNYYWQGDTLVLKLRKPPLINPVMPLKDIIVAIDPGHGGYEKGAMGPTGVPEKDINMAVSNRLKAILEEKGAKVIRTRTDDSYVGLYDRVDIANDYNPHVILSIHNNSLPYGRNPYEEHGTSTYYYYSQSLPLAKRLHENVINATGFKDFGVFYSSFVLTRPIEAPSVLLELGFMINPEEYNQLITPEFQEKTAQGIAKGLEEFLLDQVEK